MNELLDLDYYPLDQPARIGSLIQWCKSCLDEQGLFNLYGLVRPEALARILEPLSPLFATDAFTHSREHNIYFSDRVAGLPNDHPALKRFETTNRVLCADQLSDNPLLDIYTWQPLMDFLSIVMDKEHLFLMQDPLASVNVMHYRHGEALNWHFDRSEFTTTLLLQEAKQGGEFQYCSDLRSEQSPNYDGVGAFLAEGGSTARVLPLFAGTLNVFRGRNTAHRVSPVGGEQNRIIAVFSYYDRPGVMFSDEERLGFYGRPQ